MAKSFDISRVGHIGIQVTDFDRSLQWYTQTLGLTLTGKWPMGEDGAIAFMRFNEDHHNIVLFTHPTEVDDETKNLGYNALQHVAMEVADRDEWLKALADLRRMGAPANFMGGSGSRSFYFKDPDGNLLEIYSEMMKVPNGDPFPRPEYADVFGSRPPNLGNLSDTMQGR
jgi:catechol 2,3-dioxygenase-like lactoylglutathione lyase family enzyme